MRVRMGLQLRVLVERSGLLPNLGVAAPLPLQHRNGYYYFFFFCRDDKIEVSGLKSSSKTRSGTA